MVLRWKMGRRKALRLNYRVSSRFPEATEAVVSIALQTIRDLLLEEGSFLAGVADQVKELEWQLKEMKCFLKDADNRRHESSTIFNWISEIRDLVYRSESVIERHAAYQVTSIRRGLGQFVRKYSCILKDCASLHQLGSEISQITSKLEKISKDMQEIGIKRSIIINPNGEGESSTGINMSRKTFPNLEMGDCFVGMEDELKQLVHHLGKDTEDRIISLWGMGGSGKTAIAKKLYSETTDFDLSAWVCITQQCDSRSVWEDVLRQLENPKKKKGVSSLNDEPRTREEFPGLSDFELIERLCEIQREKRCFIVLDDVWELSHWEELKHPFIIQNLQSKILVTTRKQKVAEIGLAVEHGLLHIDAALELLKNKAFQYGNIPDFALEERFGKIGKEMVQKCGYLPLAISLLGGVLRKKNSIVEWELVKEDIREAIYGDEKQIDGVLNLNYESLPYYLKPCFLYMGIFNEDETILTLDLYKMWIAQGMISYENIGDKEESLIDIAELYLSELASRSIVQVDIFYDYDAASRNLKYKTVKLHDVVREICLKLGKREHFGVQSLEYKGGKLSTLLREASSHMKIQHLAVRFRNEVEHEHIVACGEDTREHIRSVRLFNPIGSNVVEFPPRSIVDFQKFKLLRDLVFVRFKFAGGKLPRGITKLVHLRCLRLEQCELDDLPSSMRNLVYMDTLDLRGSMNVEVPNVFTAMLRLKHLLFPMYGNENIRNYRVTLDEGVYDLETLAFFDSRCHELKCMGRMKNLRLFLARIHDNESLSAIMNGIMNCNKMGDCRVYIEGSCDLTSEGMLEKALTCPNLYDLSIWSKLGKALAKCGSDLLSSKLRCLDIFNSEIEDDPMGILGELPCLVTLQLGSESFVGEEMTCPANSFLRLKRLTLGGLPKLREWRVEAGAMPLLSKLKIKDCSSLEMLPGGFRGISTLQILVIKRMPKLRERVSPSGQDFHKVRHVPSIIIED
ncbi:probable disease resistance protein At1g58602 [Salvia hispanica]|uniref:probable disease resistance protein At1g58602 n=1 Tax=Salvia hispanica TaxID=49212 RepID=UPI0020096A84|nr:probable disease resistance protein At1g58602 [Salvia hispanica]XP_047947518.1 probable disease resistance protein At1g58602 [Salvia hispanica]XP_047947519.1 probable disease resistance protein At1g58602 [Salvia hispanica]XP_047947520.1 probable disease resistance protein At1g58602 [Salvia hispanica]XP_047947521.1 probable disease resistance protein At1g58602 [Salvia hispanica]XP_047947522.1 probable disease resistance protein At1g58602 [Salvia hispanica]XP_047947523.1 probable disease res